MNKFILLVSLVVLTLRTNACSCDPDLKDKDLVKKSEYAFIGEVISNIYKDEWTKEFVDGQGLKMDAIVKVIRTFKGKIVSDEVIVISSESSECQVNLSPGKRYLITGRSKLNKLGPPESGALPPFELDSKYLQDTTKLEQPDIKDRGEWIMELQQKHLIIFTSICQTRQKR